MPIPDPLQLPRNAISVAERIVARLEEEGISTVFLVLGLHLDPLVLALAASRTITIVSCSQELSAGYMAHGYALRTGTPGVCLAMGGPGAANLLPAAICARMEGAQVLFLTGGVPAWSEPLEAFQNGGPEGGRDLALFGSAVNSSSSLTEPAELDAALDRAFSTLRENGGGPAHLRLPYDLLTSPWLETSTSGPLASPETDDQPPNVAPFLAWIEGAGPRMAMLVGEASVPWKAFDALRDFAEAYGIPVATTLGAKGALPEDHALSLGHFGYAGSPRAQAAILDGPLDALLVLGADLGDRNTHRWDPRLQALGPRLMQLGASPPPPNAFSRSFIRHSEAWPKALQSMLQASDSQASRALLHHREARLGWIQQLSEIPLSSAIPQSPDQEPGLHPGRTVTELRSMLPRNAIIFLDAGVHRVFGAYYWRALAPRTVLTASRTAPLGWAISAGIGASFSSPDHRIWALTGDGCMGALALELSTAATHHLPLTVLVFNNQAMGNVLNRFRAEGPKAEALARLPKVDWPAFGRLLGIPGAQVSTVAALREAVALSLRTEGPFILDIQTLSNCAVPNPSSVFSPCGTPVVGAVSD